MAGTYAQDNMVAEQGALRYINEANIGVKISENKNLWIDAGIMPSHIGWESAIGKDNYTLTEALPLKTLRILKRVSDFLILLIMENGTSADSY